MSFQLQTSEVYFCDQFLPFDQANVSIASSSVLYGLSIYTVFNAIWSNEDQQLNLFRLEDHYRRLINSAKIMDFHSFAETWTYEKFEQTMRELLHRNNVQEDVLVRVTVFIDELTAGTKIHGLKNSVSAYIYPMGEILPRAGIHTCVSSWQRNSDNAIPARAKVNGSYVNASLMKNEALLNGYDEAIALDEHDHVAEGTVANLFIVRGGRLITPDPSTDILEGITRTTVFDLAKHLQIPTDQRAIDRSELYLSDEIFMCGSSANITPVLSVDKRPIGDGAIGPITQLLVELYKQVQQNKIPEFSGWITVTK
ncbi:MAG: Branched-chain-amino-acid aminotransferase [Patescibacteria group bacterium]|nr:Branched-chain-amino-acid aminotransferase [Patescibacteria group bacterium]